MTNYSLTDGDVPINKGAYDDNDFIHLKISQPNFLEVLI
jgi:hypothetical protein